MPTTMATPISSWSAVSRASIRSRCCSATPAVASRGDNEIGDKVDDTFGLPTEWGEYAVKAGLILMFRMRTVFDRKAGRFEERPDPLYFHPAYDDDGAVIRDGDTGLALVGSQVLGSGTAFKDYRRPKKPRA